MRLVTPLLIALKVLALLAWDASAARPSPWDNNAAIVRSSGCSGVCVHPDGLILTAKHCLDDQEQIEFTFASGKVVAATRVYVSGTGDGPAVFRANATGLPWIPVAGDRPKRLEKVTAYGFVSAQPPVCVAHGHLLGGEPSPIPGDGIPVNVASFAGQPGCSGGPLLNAQGEVCGLLLSTDGRQSYFCSWASTRAAYDAGLASLGSRPEVVAKPPADEVATVPDRETLTICTQPQRCDPCRRFEADYRTDVQFRAAIDARYRVVLVESDAGINGLAVTQIPTFITKTKRVVGYDRVDGKTKLLNELGITAAPKIGSVLIGEAQPVGNDGGPPPAGEVPPPPLESESPLKLDPPPIDLPQNPIALPHGGAKAEPLPSVYDEPSAKPIPQPVPTTPGLTPPALPPGSASHTADPGPASTIADKASKVIGVLGTGFTIYQILTGAGIATAAAGPVGGALYAGFAVARGVAGIWSRRRRRETVADVQPKPQTSGEIGPGRDQAARAPPRRTVPDLEFIRVADTRPEQDYLEALRRFCNDNQTDPERLSAAAELHRIYQQARAAPR